MTKLRTKIAVGLAAVIGVGAMGMRSQARGHQQVARRTRRPPVPLRRRRSARRSKATAPTMSSSQWTPFKAAVGQAKPPADAAC